MSESAACGEPMRVAQLLGKMNGGGVEQVVMNYYRAIDREKVQFDFFIFKNSGHVPAEEIKSLGGRIYALCTFRHPFRYVRTLEKLLRENRYTVAHCHLSTLSFLPLLAAKRAGIPVRIVHNHSTSGGAREVLRNIAKAVFKPFAKMFATERFACSQHAARWMYGAVPVCEIDDTAAPRKAVRILHNAIDTQKFAFDRDKRRKIRKELGIPAGVKVFGNVGRLCPQKNQHFLIDVFTEIVRKNKKSALIIAGEGEDTELIKARVYAAGLMGLVFFVGQRDDVDCLYSAMDCFLLTSKYEGLGMVAVEAQCAGLYCLLSDKVPVEARTADCAQFLSLKTPAADWACAAIGCAGLRSETAAEQVRAAGYDIFAEAEKLEAYYLSCRKSG